ncbi:MAG: hypothetical protein LLG16_09525, partial [Euryarchaeota archaeon]|nr:hypothetical protein [Euryarchaeota archaeon]
ALSAVFKVVPMKASAYNYLLPKATNFFAKTANYATKEGLVEGVERMPMSIASGLGKVTTISSLVTYGRGFSFSIGMGVRVFTDYYIDQLEHISEYGKPQGT